MKNQIEYQRNVIREEYITDTDIDNRINKGIVITTATGKRKQIRSVRGLSRNEGEVNGN